MTSPSLLSQPVRSSSRREQSALLRFGLPAALFCVTLLSTTAVGMRYMENFHLGRPPLAFTSDADILPYTWVFHHLDRFASGLPFSLTLIGILLVHEFGHYFACRFFGVRCSLPYMLPAPRSAEPSGPSSGSAPPFALAPRSSQLEPPVRSPASSSPC